MASPFVKANMMNKNEDESKTNYDLNGDRYLLVFFFNE